MTQRVYDYATISLNGVEAPSIRNLKIRAELDTYAPLTPSEFSSVSTVSVSAPLENINFESLQKLADKIKGDRAAFRQVAHHEAGHAVMAHLLGMTVRSILLFGPTEGCTAITATEEQSVDQHAMAMMGAGGVASELIFAIRTFSECLEYLTNRQYPDALVMGRICQNRKARIFAETVEALVPWKDKLSALAAELMDTNVDRERFLRIIGA